MQKTLGGDRLGSGKKMKVDLHGYGRSTHDLGYVWRSTQAPGTLVPFMSQIALPGDKWDIRLNCDIKTHPTIGPLFGSYKCQLDIFQAPIRLYNSLLHNNMLGIGNHMSRVKLPVLRFTVEPTTPTTDIDNSQINPSSIASYLGVRGLGVNNEATNKTRDINGTAFLAYWEIYKNYYANKQEEIGAVIHTPAYQLIETVDVISVTTGGDEETIEKAPVISNVTLFSSGQIIEISYIGTPADPGQIIVNTVEYGDLELISLGINWIDTTANFNSARWGTITIRNWRYISNEDVNTGKPKIATFDLSEIDKMRKKILAYDSETDPFVINDPVTPIYPYSWITGGIEDFPNLLSSQEGLGLKTYQSDLFNNWLQTEWIDGAGGITEVTAIDTTGGSFTLDTLNLSKKVYDMLNRIAVTGGSYNDWLEVTYDHEHKTAAESPMYMGGLIKEVIFQEVVSNSESADQPLGTLAGRGMMAKKHKGGTIVFQVNEPSYIIGIVSLTPRVDYSQGNNWDIHLKTLDDLHKPALDEIGFQELIQEQMAWWTTEYDETTDTWIQKSAGKQPAWMNYMTNVNQTRGNFAIANNEMFMTLNRRYERNNEVGLMEDLTTYIDPSKYNFIFAETALDAQNFWTQIACDITVRRKMSARLMPNL